MNKKTLVYLAFLGSLSLTMRASEDPVAQSIAVGTATGALVSTATGLIAYVFNTKNKPNSSGWFRIYNGISPRF